MDFLVVVGQCFAVVSEFSTAQDKQRIRYSRLRAIELVLHSPAIQSSMVVQASHFHWIQRRPLRSSITPQTSILAHISPALTPTSTRYRRRFISTHSQFNR